MFCNLIVGPSEAFDHDISPVIAGNANVLVPGKLIGGNLVVDGLSEVSGNLIPRYDLRIYFSVNRARKSNRNLEILSNRRPNFEFNSVCCFPKQSFRIIVSIIKTVLPSVLKRRSQITIPFFITQNVLPLTSKLCSLGLSLAEKHQRPCLVLPPEQPFSSTKSQVDRQYCRFVLSSGP